MKKKAVLVLICLVAITSVGFAHDFDVGGTFMFNQSIKYSDTALFGGGLNIGYTNYFSKIIGFGVYSDLMVAPYGGNLFFIFDALVGISFKFIDTGKFSLPIAVGTYYDYVSLLGNSDSTGVFNFGLGGNITARFKFTERMGLYARLQTAYTFFDGGEIWITPSIGVGFSF
jgi:hypothetical protein